MQTLTIVCNDHCYMIPELFIIPKGNLIFLSPQQLLILFLYGYISYKSSHTIHSLLCLFSLIYHNIFKVHPSNSLFCIKKQRKKSSLDQYFCRSPTLSMKIKASKVFQYCLSELRSRHYFCLTKMSFGVVFAFPNKTAALI